MLILKLQVQIYTTTVYILYHIENRRDAKINQDENNTWRVGNQNVFSSNIKTLKTSCDNNPDSVLCF